MADDLVTDAMVQAAEGAIDMHKALRAALAVSAVPRVVEAAEYYADQYCEGWCHENDTAPYDDCGGCRARMALAALRGDAP